MALQFNDLLGRRLDVLAEVAAMPIDATGTFPLFTTPSGLWTAPGGLKQTIIGAIVYTNPAIVGGTLTASIGSGSVATDYLASGSQTLPTSGVDTVIFPPATSQVAGVLWLAYGQGVVINFKITAAATALSKMAIVVLGWTA